MSHVLLYQSLIITKQYRVKKDANTLSGSNMVVRL